MAILGFFVILWILWKLLGTTVKYAIPFLIFAWIIIFFLKFWWLLLILGLGYFFYYIGTKEQAKEKAQDAKKTSSEVNDYHINDSNESDNIKSNLEPEQMLKGLEKNIPINTEIGIGSISNAPSKEKISVINNSSVHKLRRKLYDFIVFDIETTGFNKYENDIIQLSAIKVKNDKVVDKFDSFINPGYLLDKKIIYLTGITDENLKNAPSVDIVISEFKKFIENLPLVGHNIIKFDIPFIQANGFDLEDIYAVDTWKLAQKKEFTSQIENLKLPTLKKYYGITNRSHNSLNDCETNLIVYQKLRDDNLDKVVLDVSKIPQTLTGKRFCITGEFIESSRHELIEEIINHGGRYTKTVSSKTDYLLDGKQISDILSDGVHSSSEIKAKELIANGSSLKIISLEDLKSMIGVNYER